MKQLCSEIYNHHIRHHHNADYEVCRSLLCAFAYWLERVFEVFEVTHG